MRSVFAVFLILIAYRMSHAQEPSSLYESGWFVHGLYSSISGVPISYSNAEFPPTKSVESSSSGLIVGLGYRFSSEHSRWYIDVQADYSSGTFSDWRVKNRGIRYYMVGVAFGYLLSDEGPFSMFGSLGGGGIVQSQYYDNREPREDHYNEYEYLGEAEYPIYAGLGLRVAVVRNILIRGESRFYIIGDSGSSYSAATNTYYIGKESTSEGVGSVFGIGIEVFY